MAGTVFVRQGDSAQEFSVQAEASIGRAPDNTIVLSDLAVSRHHASVRLDAGTWRIVDLGSAGGTHVGDAALDPRVPQVVKPGEVVSIGPYRIELTTGTVPSAGPTIVAGGAATIVAPSPARPAAGATQILVPKPRITITSAEGTREVEIKGDRVTLGRDDTSGVNDIVVKVSQVSSRHLEFRRVAGGGYEVEDLGSTNGTTINGERIKRRVLQEGDRLDIAGTVQIAYRSEPELASLPGAPAVAEDHALDITGKGTITIGRDESCDVRLSQPTVSKQHARIVTTSDGHGRAIEDLGSTNGTFVNAERVLPGAPRVLRPDDEIRVGLVKLVFSADELQHFDDSHAVGLDAVGLNQKIGQGVNLLKNISFSVLPNEFVAVVGTSGAGKSTLLGALSGLKPASDGAVLLNGQGLYQNYDAFRTAMGYVPQDDILHKELPVGRALEYAAELRLPDDTTAQERAERVRDVIKQLGLEERRDVAIGSLSGGQRKRVSIGAELLTEPGLFFLDEATSGLDPGIEAQLMRLLRGLADEGHTVVLITHATKNVMLCDQVVFLARGGYMAYYGPPDKALEHFEVEDFDGIYEKLESESTPEAWAQKAAKSAVFDEFVTKRLASHGITGGVETVPRATVAPPPVRRSSGFRQLRILSRRYFDIVRRDRASFAILFILAPALGSMDFIAWKRQTLTFMNGDTGQALSMLFLASLIPFLVGALSNVREIVKEAPIYARERAVSLEIWPYLSSKISIAFMFAFYHAAALLIVKLIVVDFPDAGRAQFFEFYGTLALATMCGVLWALVISALTNKEEQAMLIIIAVIVVQVVFSGGVVSLASLGPVGTVVGSATSTSWAFKALVASAGMTTHGCGGTFPACHLPGFGAFTNDAARSVSYDSTTKNYGDVFNADVFVCWAAMVAIMIGLCVVLYFLQKRKDRL